jgi:signal transduction histidine kinase
LFGDLRIRPKLIVLHNLFFLVLAVSAYFSLIPLIESQIEASRGREIALVRQIFAAGRPLPEPELHIFGERQGTAGELGIPAHSQRWLDDNPGVVAEAPAGSSDLYRKDPASGLYQRVSIPDDYYEGLLREARLNLFAVLGAIYVLAVLLLELVIMPRYVYRPIRLTLAADRAARLGDRRNELIDRRLILGDEIGDIMRSRNETVADLREQEASLEQALARLEDLARDLQRKNHMLETAKRSMAAQDRLATLGLLSASVAHELNTPLAVLCGSIEKLIETVTDGAAQQRLARLQRVAHRLRRISAGLLDFSTTRSDENERRPVAIRPLVEEAWSLEAIDEKAAAITFANDVDPAHKVLGNADRLMQVFVNLLRNALYAIPVQGHIVVQSRLEPGEGGALAVITVEDDGVGIPEEVLPNLFDAFVTSRLDSRGTGLGLTVASGIVQQHGGTISASNRPEGGARLRITLPAAVPQTGAATGVESGNEPGAEPSAETGAGSRRSAPRRHGVAQSEPRD